jgi:predicted transcriptional regulator
MKTITYILVGATMLMTGSLVSGCMSSDQKKEAANSQVANAEDNLNVAKDNAEVVAEKAATTDELKTFKLESELKIKQNEVSIAELKLKMNNHGAVQDEVYARKIDSLEFKNTNLNKRMGDYEKTHSNWTKFKHDFNRDLDELGNSLKRIASGNK